ncbi:MAG: indolepyruvate oxidoreductase subunit beta [Candidatus Aenigmarchaeota archaeon]|nr:indolepyruvate oxidoreductase subunit beta [Candidatus Aenigmarchaeota archaeon]
MKDFNIVIAGVGGQGILTLGYIISKTAMDQGFDVRMAEVHGLSQRYGAIVCHIRFGKKIFSPLVMCGKADLVIGLEPLEGLRNAYYGSKKTVFLLDNYPIIPVSVYLFNKKYPKLEEIGEDLKPFSKKVIFVNASKKAKELAGNVIAANIYMVGAAVSKRLLPLRKDLVFKNIKGVIKPKYYEVNEKVFNAAFEV